MEGEIIEPKIFCVESEESALAMHLGQFFAVAQKAGCIDEMQIALASQHPLQYFVICGKQLPRNKDIMDIVYHIDRIPQDIPIKNQWAFWIGYHQALYSLYHTLPLRTITVQPAE